MGFGAICLEDSKHELNPTLLNRVTTEDGKQDLIRTLDF
jgi:hypothetical protein